MNRRRRLLSGRLCSIETLERRSMLAADAGECVVDVEFLSDCGEPGADAADEQGLVEVVSVMVLPFPCVFEQTGIIAVDPPIIVDPIFDVGLPVEAGPLIEQNGIDEVLTSVETVWGDASVDGTSWNVDPSMADTSDEQAVSEYDTSNNDDVGTMPWAGSPEESDDRIVCVYDGPICRFGPPVPSDTEQADDAEVPVAADATPSTSDNQAPAVLMSSGAASPSTATSAATAQAFAAFAASFGRGTSFGQGGGDVQSGLPFFGGRRTARR